MSRRMLGYEPPRGLGYALGPRGFFYADAMVAFETRVTSVSSAAALSLDVGAQQRTFFFDATEPLWLFGRRCTMMGLEALEWSQAPPDLSHWLCAPRVVKHNTSHLRAVVEAAPAPFHARERIARQLAVDMVEARPGWVGALERFRAVQDACARGGVPPLDKPRCRWVLERLLLDKVLAPWWDAEDMRRRLAILRGWATGEEHSEKGMVRLGALLRRASLEPGELLTAPEMDYVCAYLQGLGLELGRLKAVV